MTASSPGTATPEKHKPSGPPTIPQGLHHVAYITYDSKATADFYTRIMGMPMVNAVMDDHLPSTGDRTPYFHTFFRMADGSTLAFFESPGLPATPPDPTPAFDNFKHIALQVPTRADVENWTEWLKDNDIGVEIVDHHIIYSAYFHDPNGVRLEITTTLVDSWNDQETLARGALDEWTSARSTAIETGGDVNEALVGVIARHAHQASIANPPEAVSDDAAGGVQ